MKTHMKEVHEKDKPFKCPIGNATFSRKTVVKVHIEPVHERKKLYTCNICSVSLHTILHWNYTLYLCMNQRNKNMLVLPKKGIWLNMSGSYIIRKGHINAIFVMIALKKDVHLICTLREFMKKNNHINALFVTPIFLMYIKWINMLLILMKIKNHISAKFAILVLHKFQEWKCI